MEESTKNRVILGIDVSTACLGVSIVRYDGDNFEILKISYVKLKVPSKIKGTEALFLKSKLFKEEFIEKYKDIGITDIIIEEPLPSSQNINTVSTLLRFNGMISQSIYEAIGIVPKYITSYDARKYAFPELMGVRKYDKKDNTYAPSKYAKDLKDNKLVLFAAYPFSVDKKYIVWNKISEMYGDIEWEYDKKGELKTENFDASDSLTCILGYINKEKYGNTEPKIIEYNKEEINNDNIKLLRFNYIIDFCGQHIEKKIDITDY